MTKMKPNKFIDCRRLFVEPVLIVDCMHTDEDFFGSADFAVNMEYRGGVFDNCMFTNTEIGATFAGTRFIDCEFLYVHFGGAIFDGSFDGCEFTGCTAVDSYASQPGMGVLFDDLNPYVDDSPIPGDLYDPDQPPGAEYFMLDEPVPF